MQFLCCDYCRCVSFIAICLFCIGFAFGAARKNHLAGVILQKRRVPDFQLAPIIVTQNTVCTIRSDPSDQTRRLRTSEGIRKHKSKYWPEASRPKTINIVPMFSILLVTSAHLLNKKNNSPFAMLDRAVPPCFDIAPPKGYHAQRSGRLKCNSSSTSSTPRPPPQRS